VGVVPILDDGTCWFSAIDFDNYNEFTVKRFVMDAKRSGFPFVWCKSKSGGAHLYTFFSEPANAAKVRAKLSDLARTLGYPKIEIFPKQEQLDVSKGEVGNWINIPYFNSEMTQRYAFDDRAQPIAEFEKFLDYAESKRISPDDFDQLKVEAQEIPFSDAPPCIQAMAHNGVSDGERNKSMFQEEKAPGRLAGTRSGMERGILHAAAEVQRNSVDHFQVAGFRQGIRLSVQGTRVR